MENVSSRSLWINSECVDNTKYIEEKRVRALQIFYLCKDYLL